LYLLLKHSNNASCRNNWPDLWPDANDARKAEGTLASAAIDVEDELTDQSAVGRVNGGGIGRRNLFKRG